MKQLIIILICLGIEIVGYAQPGRGDVREGNRNFKAEKFAEAEQAYRKALEETSVNRIASFNLGDALYRQEKFEEAGRQFEAAASNDVAKNNTARAYHNLGNSLLQAGKIDESIEAYKDALRRNPSDLDTKYNLSYAKMLKKKQEQQQQQQNQDGDQKDQQKQDQKDQKDQQQGQQDQKDQQQGQQDQKEQQQQADQQQSQEQNAKISKEDAKRLLEALANDEKKVQDKVKKEKAKANRVRTIKDW